MTPTQPEDEFFDWAAPAADPIAWLDSLVDFETSAPSIAAGKVEGLSLEPMRQLMAVLGDPQFDYKVIHVTGTNGKGSVTAMAAGLVGALGLSTGSYTSPDHGVVNERIVANGAPIADDQFRVVLAEVANAAQIARVQPTRFEALTAAALTWFSTIAVDVAVVEVGLLGRFDATNVVRADVAVITSLGKDHTDGTRGWERRVLEEKAGIVEAESTVVVGGVDPAMRGVIEAEGPADILWRGEQFWVDKASTAVGGRLVDLVTPQDTYREVHLPLHGGFQDANAAVAVAAVEALIGRGLPEGVVDEAMAGVKLPGRVEIVARQPLLVIDGAHNAHAARALASTIDAEFHVAGSRILVLGMLKGRSAKEFLEPFAEFGWDLVIVSALGGERGQSPTDLLIEAQELNLSTEVVVDPVVAVGRALGVAAEEDLVLVTGSVRMVPIGRRAFHLAQAVE